jgi:hypothetical protein
MFAPFFHLAAVSPSRRSMFYSAVISHLALIAILVVMLSQQKIPNLVMLGQLLLVGGIVEGAVLVGWRMTQLPKSQALEFLLVSPLRPSRLFLAEVSVGLSFLALVTLSGLPVLAILAAWGVIDPLDLVPLIVMPFTWGAITGLGLTWWAFEPLTFRRIGELMMLLWVLLYLIVGVLAGEKFPLWLSAFSEETRVLGLRSFVVFHTHNPFGTMHHWMERDLGSCFSQAILVQSVGLVIVGLLVVRGASRLQGHFHERHYEPVRDVSHEVRPPVGDQPLSWWAIKRVSEYSGQVNLWLAVGFSLLYACYIVARDQWPPWMGRFIFFICDSGGGPAGIATALVVLSAVPAAFQYGLWDNSTQDRCRRLELLLLTDLRPEDYWNAAAAAAWFRGRGYLWVAGLLLLASALGGRTTILDLVAGLSVAVLLWAFYFAMGFRGFARGSQANGLGLLLTVGLPLIAFLLGRLGLPVLGSLLPPGLVFYAAAGSLGWMQATGASLMAVITLVVIRQSLRECDASLRRWYDQNHGSKGAH